MDNQINATPIGKVETLEGQVSVIRADGTRVELKAGDPVYQGDVLQTGDGGAAGLVFIDNTVFSMGENGSMSLDQMVFDASNNEGNLAFTIGKGIFTFVSGQIAKTDPDAMVLNSPVGTIGIRGTDGGIDIADGMNMTVVLRPEDGTGQIGEIVLSNDAGVVVLNEAYQAARVSALDTAPSAPFPMTLGQYAGTFGDILAIRPAHPATLQPLLPADPALQQKGGEANDPSEPGKKETDDGETSSGTDDDKQQPAAEQAGEKQASEVALTKPLFAATEGNGNNNGAEQTPFGFNDHADSNQGQGNGNGNGNDNGNGSGNGNGNANVDSSGNVIGGGNGNGNDNGNGNGNGNNGADTGQTVSGTETVTLTANSDDTVTGGSGNDTITLSGGAEAGDTVDLGGGIDSLVLDNGGNTLTIGNTESVTGGSGDDVLTFTGNVNVTVNGGAGNDTIETKNGDDILIGGLGSDILSGGSGQDIFRYEAANEGGDTINGFNKAQDGLQFLQTAFNGDGDNDGVLDGAGMFVKGSGAAAIDADDHWLFDTDTNALSYDADGSGAGAAVQIAAFDTANFTDADITFAAA